MICEDYGKYEPGNKISFKDFATYLKNLRGVDFEEEIVPKMRKAIADTLVAFWNQLNLPLTWETEQLDENQRPSENLTRGIINQFEIFGYDFMIDDDMSVYLIEVNTNPCLDTSPCSLLQRLIS